jgi:hypothetical protein
VTKIVKVTIAIIVYSTPHNKDTSLRQEQLTTTTRHSTFLSATMTKKTKKNIQPTTITDTFGIPKSGPGTELPPTPPRKLPPLHPPEPVPPVAPNKDHGRNKTPKDDTKMKDNNSSNEDKELNKYGSSNGNNTNCSTSNDSNMVFKFLNTLHAEDIITNDQGHKFIKNINKMESHLWYSTSTNNWQNWTKKYNGTFNCYNHSKRSSGPGQCGYKNARFSIHPPNLQRYHQTPPDNQRIHHSN